MPPRLPLPPGLAGGGSTTCSASTRCQIPASAIDHFVHPTHYAISQYPVPICGHGIAVPPLPSYLANLVAFVRAHPEIPSDAMV